MLLSQWRTPVAGALGALLLGGQIAQAVELDLTSTDSIKSATRTVVDGMMSYYKGNESGMAVGLLPDPYYWWEAGAMFDLMVQYWFYTGDDTYNDVTTQALLAQVGPDNDFMPPNQTKTEGNDDQAFWAFAAMSAAELGYPDPPPKQPSWLGLVQAVFNLQASRWDDTSCGGGLRWQIFTFNKGYDYKNSISNGGFFQLAARLARYTGNDTYAQWAEKSYDWIETTPLFTDDYLIYDGAQVENNCTIASKLQWTYNIGTYIMGAANMYNYTNGDTKWRTRLEGMLKGMQAFFPPQYGGNIMVEIACEPQQSCNYDQPSFKAYLSRWMAATTQIAPFTAQTIMPKLHDSAQGAAGQCSGGTDGVTCGRTWHSTTWDGKYGVGEQMSAMSIIQGNLISKVGAPVTAKSGGTSKSDPAAGSQGDNPSQAANPNLNKPVTTGDRAGAVPGEDLSDRRASPQASKAADCGATSHLTDIPNGRPPLHPPSAGERPSIVLISGICLSPSYLIGRGFSFQHQKFPALFPRGNKATAITTSPFKKRKLSPSLEPAEEPLSASAATDPSSPPQLVTSDDIGPTSSPSPPRFLPPHLVAEGARAARSPTPEPPNTGESSPITAYAGLNLDSDGSAYGSGNEASSTKRGSPLAVGLRGGASTRRTVSPAKRRASAMVGEGRGGRGGRESRDADTEMVDDMERPNPDRTLPSIEVSTGPTGVRRNSKSQMSRHRRETSVDMLGQDADKSAYRTPQSGVSSTAISTATEPSPSTELPPIDEQVRQVMELSVGVTLSEGQKGYLIAIKWLSRVLARASNALGSDSHRKEAKEGPIGPVDNRSIVLTGDETYASLTDETGASFIPLKPGLIITEDFEIIPETAWNLIIQWYGLAQESPVITRFCHNTSMSETAENLQYENYPPVFTILKLPDRSSGLTKKDLEEAKLLPCSILASRHERYQRFLKRAKSLVNIDLTTKVRVWRILGGLTGGHSGMITPAQSRSSSPAPGAIMPVDPGSKLVLDTNVFAGLQLGSERELIDAKDESANDKYNGHSSLDFVGLRQDSVIVLEEQIGGPAGGEWVSDGAAAKARANGVPLTIPRSGAVASQNSLKANANNSRASSPNPGMMTRGRQAKSGRTIGTIGLNNLGNTCYMNSALQCVRNVEELTKYFLEDKYKKELNPQNPLAHNGQVAKAYASLLQDMYNPNSTTSFAPRNFKNIIGKYGPSFSGYQQQDSQEFLLFLLDGLQEDLNRIHKKPYIEKPDSTDEMVNDQEALRGMADKCWEIYKKRNDSVITDLFAGMYKSTVVCPVCDKVSIIFDPFNNLTLQLPIENMWSRPIQYYPLHDRPVNVAIDIDKNASFRALKEHVAGKFPGTDPKNLIVSEIYRHKFYKIFDDNKSISEETIVDTDIIAIFEIEAQPTNWPPPPKSIRKKPAFSHYATEEINLPGDDSPVADMMMVSVFFRHPVISHTRLNPGRDLFGSPSLIVLNREEARDYDAILQKVLARVATTTTRNFLAEEETSMSTTEDSDIVLTNADDADVDSKVHTESLESEDGMVDVSMKDPPEQDATKPPRSPTGTSIRKLPKILQRGAFIPAGVRNLFDMKYIATDNEMVPLGWHSFGDEGKNFPSLASRLKHPSDAVFTKRKGAMEQINRALARGSSPSSDDEIDDPPVTVSAETVQNDSDSDGLPQVEHLAAAGSTFKSKQAMTYSKKGKHSLLQQSDQDEELHDDGDEPLIRLGEALLLEWTPEAYDALYGGSEDSDDDEMRGAATVDGMPSHPDPQLEERRQTRANRRKNGISLEDCLEEFGKPEILSENDAWYCPRCKEHRRASKKFELWKAPDILVIHLKRFSAQGRFRDKLDVRVDFPLEGLDLTSRVAVQEDKSMIYDLFGVDNHYGGLGGGHYTAFAQNFIDKNWYEYNDSAVSKRSNPETAVVTSAAYLLFYRRRAPQPLGGPFFEQIFASGVTDTPSESQADSRSTSPAGEGKRLDAASSRNGSSSVLQRLGAAHQAPGSSAGEAGVDRMGRDMDEDLPAYSAHDPRRGIGAGLGSGAVIDEDEAIGDMDEIAMHGDHAHDFSNNPQWSFGLLNQNTGRGNSPEPNENLFDDDEAEADSNRNGSNLSAEDRDRMLDFEDEPGTAQGDWTPPQDIVPILEGVPTLEGYEEPDAPVAEVKLPDVDREELAMD